MKKALIVLLMMVAALHVVAQPFDPNVNVVENTLSQSSKVFLITAEPGDAIYERFGHTAIRVIDPTLMMDVVYHYGVFDYLQPNFVGRFVSGATDYSIGCWPWKFFLFDYTDRRSSVYSQELNLTLQQRNDLFRALERNNQPKNRLYRYNFVYDNCATRPYDMVMKAIGSNIHVGFDNQDYVGTEIIPNIQTAEPTDNLKTINGKPATFRNIIEEYLGMNTWWRFAIDIVLGEEADRPLHWSQMIAFPRYLKMIAGQTTVKSEQLGNYPLTSNGKYVLKYNEVALPNNGVFNPVVLCLLWLLVVVCLTFNDWRHRTYKPWVDYVMFGLYGFFGTVVFYLMFFSYHPLVHCNYNLLWINPLQLLFALALIKKPWRKHLTIYHWLNAVAIIVAIAFYGFGKQQMHPAFLSLMVAMLIRSVNYNLTIPNTKK